MKKLVVVLSLLLLPVWALHAQTLAFNIEAPPELEVMGESPLDFGNILLRNSKTISRYDTGVGEFWIEGPNKCEVKVTIATSTPTPLIHEEYSDQFSINSLEARYSNSGESSSQSNSTLFDDDGTATFLINKNDDSGSSQCEPPGQGKGRGQGQGGSPSSIAYVYIYGSTEVVNNIRAGTYTGSITINVEAL